MVLLLSCNAYGVVASQVASLVQVAFPRHSHVSTPAIWSAAKFRHKHAPMHVQAAVAPTWFYNSKELNHEVTMRPNACIMHTVHTVLAWYPLGLPDGTVRGCWPCVIIMQEKSAKLQGQNFNGVPAARLVQ